MCLSFASYGGYGIFNFVGNPRGYFTPSHKPVDDDNLPTNLPEALRLVAILRHERATEAARLAQLEKHLETLEEIVATLESKNHDLANTAQSLHRN